MVVYSTYFNGSGVCVWQCTSALYSMLEHACKNLSISKFLKKKERKKGGPNILVIKINNGKIEGFIKLKNGVRDLGFLGFSGFSGILIFLDFWDF